MAIVEYFSRSVMRFFIKGLIIAATLGGCAHLATPDTPIAPGVSTPLRVGETRLVSGTSTALGVVEVVEDSRCPTGVQCVWEGRVRMALRLGETAVTLAADSSFAANGLVVRLDSVTPYPASTSRNAVPEYRAFVTVVKEAGLSPPSP